MFPINSSSQASEVWRRTSSLGSVYSEVLKQCVQFRANNDPDLVRDARGTATWQNMGHLLQHGKRVYHAMFVVLM